ncbi:hypothetical protein IEQ34_009192 [Dendrobium chrysotoxum]|uniref:Transmembrane protein n=1 Tax=Dendrobium chrysotoxum TaxID=161865 RepID=A0AAV7GZW9_DENCH|nr:hypothetical protein IEQ34_009192 [Dendrobium chrysotoxum]
MPFYESDDTFVPLLPPSSFSRPVPSLKVVVMGTDDSKDLLKNVDWKTVGSLDATDSSGLVTRKRLPKKVRQVPEYYFLPRRALPSALAIYGACCAAGVGAGMLLEVWVKKRIKGAYLLSYTSCICIFIWRIFSISCMLN